jgi:Zn-finger nucleic acid-binding protein
MNRASLAPTLAPQPASAALDCPRCGTPMVTYQRSGVTVDQCPDCRGLFLDRGELERLVEAESGGWTGPRMQPPEPIPLSRLQAGRGYRSEWGAMPGDER